MKEQGIHVLSDIDVEEVSLVGKPANRRKFLLFKSEGGEHMDDKEVIGEEIEKASNEHEKNAAKGALNILGKFTKFNDVVKLLQKILSGSAEKEDKEEVSDEIKEKVEEKDKEVEKVDLQKANDELKERVEKAEARVADLEKSDKRRKVEDIAKSLDGDKDETITYLEELAEKLPEETFGKVVEREKAQKKRLDESELYKEKGKTTPDENSAGGKLEKMIKEAVEKGEDKFAATDRILRDNPELYAEHQKEATKSVATTREEG